MTKKLFFQVVGLVFGAKALFAVVYLIAGWQTNIGNWVMPSWLLVVAFIVDGYLAYTAYKFSKK